MEKWKETHEMVKADIQQLKEQMSQVLEALKELKNTEEASAIPHQRVQNTQIFPPHGFPPGYTSLFKGDQGQRYIQEVPNYTEKENGTGAATFTNPQGTTQPDFTPILSITFLGSTHRPNHHLHHFLHPSSPLATQPYGHLQHKHTNRFFLTSIFCFYFLLHNQGQSFSTPANSPFLHLQTSIINTSTILPASTISYHSHFSSISLH